MRCLFLSLVVIVITCTAFAQGASRGYDVSQAPPWVSGKMPSSINGINYKITIGEGVSYNEARKAAYAMLVHEIAMEHGSTISTTTLNSITQTNDNGTLDFKQGFSATTVIEYDNFRTSVTKVDEYSEIHKNVPQERRYAVWQLYAIDTPYASTIHLQYSNKYGAEAPLLSIIPGGGQFYKQQYVRGALFLGSEVLAVGSIIFFQNRYNYDMKCSKETSILDLEIEYNKMAQQQAMYRNIAIGAATAIWVWNLLDAALTTGRPHYVNKGLKFTASATQQNEMLLGFYYTF